MGVSLPTPHSILPWSLLLVLPHQKPFMRVAFSETSPEVDDDEASIDLQLDRQLAADSVANGHISVETSKCLFAQVGAAPAVSLTFTDCVSCSRAVCVPAVNLS